jgi:hypothetical protein
MKITLKKLKEIVNSVLKEEFGNLSEESIRRDMKELIEEQKESVIMTALGVERSHWNDHELEVKYNGSFRQNLKILSEEYLSPIAKDILREIFVDYHMELTPTQMGSLRRVYKEIYMETAKDKISELAREHAMVHSKSLFEDFLKEQEDEADVKEIA